MFITVERGAAKGIEVDKFMDTGDDNPEEEVITTGHAKVKSAKFNKKLKQYEITLSK